MRCVSCGFANPDGLKFCNECGVALKRRCTQCGSENAPQAKFCGECGQALRAPAPATVTPQREQPDEQASGALPVAMPHTHEAERRQLTVLFCDLVGSTALSTQLDPEDWHEVVRVYQETCARVIQRHGGYLAQYLGDGVLVYFGYPIAHEDDARRAVRAGLEIITAVAQQVPSPLAGKRNAEGVKEQSLRVRIGIHTGLVVIGEVGSSEKREMLALGETPNIAARIQGLAEPDSVIISAVTRRLIEGQFECQPFGSHLVKGIAAPIAVYHVQNERQSVSPLAGRSTLTPLVGREQETGLLIDRWEQTKEGHGQVVLLSGEPGIGKSRLAYTLREHVIAAGSLLFEARCSPYHQHSAFYPLIDVLQRTLLLTREDTDEEKVTKLERALALYEMSETVPLFADLLSLPTPVQYPALNLTPQKQKERMLQALLQLMVAQAERQATVSVWEDVHWVDPSSLEFLSLLIEQIPTTKLFLVLTFRPEFTPPWKPRSHLSQLVLNRLGKRQVEAMIEKAAAGKTLPPEIIEQIRVRTDGVPLFVEELTKSVIEATTDASVEHVVSLHTIPATLQEALLARLDRLSTARQVAQLGATLGREFSYELLRAVAPVGEADLHAALEKLVEAEILHQRGMGEQARYIFKHALIQDTAYQSLLKSTRQHYHQEIARVLEKRFPEISATQPELLAHHYTEAGSIEHAIPYWQHAGQRANERSAYHEAVRHSSRGLELLRTLPETRARTQQELLLQLTLGAAIMSTKGHAAPDAEEAYARARQLCQHGDETPELFQVLGGLWVFYHMRAELETAEEMIQQSLRIGSRLQDKSVIQGAHLALGTTLSFRGAIPAALEHYKLGLVFESPDQDVLRTQHSVEDLRAAGLAQEARLYWLAGYPDQARKRSHEAVALAQRLQHPPSVAMTTCLAAWVHQFRREAAVTQSLAEVLLELAAEQENPFYSGLGLLIRGWALAQQGHEEEGIAQLRTGYSQVGATGTRLMRPYHFMFLAEAYQQAGRPEEGLPLIEEALAIVQHSKECWGEAELYRLKGELTLQQERKEQEARPERREKLGVSSKEQDAEHRAGSREQEAEGCFWKAIEIARKQQAKSLELRASLSLARLWQQQGKRQKAHKMLSEIYNWFTEGFDTIDLREAKALLDMLG